MARGSSSLRAGRPARANVPTSSSTRLPTGPATGASAMPPRPRQRTSWAPSRSTGAVSEPATCPTPGRAAVTRSSAPTPFWMVRTGVPGHARRSSSAPARSKVLTARTARSGAVGSAAGVAARPTRTATRRPPGSWITTSSPASVETHGSTRITSAPADASSPPRSVPTAPAPSTATRRGATGMPASAVPLTRGSWAGWRPPPRPRGPQRGRHRRSPGPRPPPRPPRAARPRA